MITFEPANLRLIADNMYDNDSRGISYSGGFFMLIAFAVAGLVFSVVLGNVISMAMTGKNITDLLKSDLLPAYRPAFQAIQALNQLLGYFIPTLVVAALLNRKPARLIGFRRGFTGQQAGLVVLCIILAMTASVGLTWLTQQISLSPSLKNRFDQMELEYSKQMLQMLSLKTTGDYLMALLLMAVLPAICEETLFRGGLQNFLTRSTKKPLLSILIVSVIFSAVHFSFYGFLSRFFLGVVLGYLYHYSGRMWPNMLAHFLNNAAALTALYVSSRNGNSLADDINSREGSPWLLIAVPLAIIALLFFKQVSATLTQRSSNQV